MTRNECERKLVKQLQEVWKTYHEYNPEGKYLSISFMDGDWVNCNNAHFAEDRQKPCAFYGHFRSLRTIRFRGEL